MFFFTRRGYINEIKRLQIALNDSQEALLKAHESHQKREDSLLDRLTSLLDPGALREARNARLSPSERSEVVPQMLSRPKSKRGILHDPKIPIRKPLYVDFNRHSEGDKKSVEDAMNASTEEAN